MWNPAICSCKDGKCLASFINDSLITCNEIIEEIIQLFKQILIKKVDFQSQNLYSLLAFLLIIIALLIAVSIYCYLIIYLTKQKHLLLLHVSNNELK